MEGYARVYDRGGLGVWVQWVDAYGVDTPGTAGHANDCKGDAIEGGHVFLVAGAGVRD